MMAWLQVAVVFSVIILVHEFGHFIMAIKSGIKVEIFSLGLGPKLFSINIRGIDYRISAVPFGGYVKMAGEDPSEERKGQPWEFLSAPVGKRFSVSLAGSLLNYLFGFLLFIVVFIVGYPVTTTVNLVMDGYPAKEAGILPEDRIIAVDGTPVRNRLMATDMIKRKTEGPINLRLQRKNSAVNVTLRPAIKEGEDIFGNPVKVAMIGVVFSGTPQYEKFGALESVSLAFNEAVWITKLTYQMIWSMVGGRVSLKEVAGPAGIVVVIAVAAKAGVSALFYITALISVSLAIFNLLPLPPLDGGLILFLGIEKLRGKPLNFKTQERIMRAGWTFLIAFMLFVTYNDIFRFIIKK